MFIRYICTSIFLLLVGSVFAQVHDPKELSADPVKASGAMAPML